MYKAGILLMIVLSFESCSFAKRRGSWGQRALWPLNSSNLVEALKRNIASPHVWPPLAGAAAIHWGGYDEKISEWAIEENVIYDHHGDADRWSDNFNQAFKYQMFLLPMLAPSWREGGDAGDYVASKARGYGAIVVASRVPDRLHDRLAKAVHRHRPNNRDARSFPSGHAMAAGSRNVITARTFDSIPMDPSWRLGLKGINTVMASGVVWARIEGRRHYPSDALTGYALGAFFSGFLYDFLMNAEDGESVTVAPLRGGGKVEYSLAF